MRPFSYRRFFAWLMDRAGTYDPDDVLARKRRLFAPLRGTVVELGPGAGNNLALYPAGVRLVAVEPNRWMHPYLAGRATRAGLAVDLLAGRGEEIPLAAASAEAVVCSLVLCSVDEPATTLREVLRILRPGGRFVFLEHVAAPQGSRLRRWQRRLRRAWRCCGDGCHLDRETWVAIEQAGFVGLEYERFDADVPLPLVRPWIAGRAFKAGFDDRPPSPAEGVPAPS